MGWLTHDRTPPDDLEDLSNWIHQLIQDFEEHPDDEVRERIFALLDGIDLLHRATLTRLVALLQGPGAGIVWHRARQDPLIRALLDLYDLLPEAATPSEEGTVPLIPAPAPVSGPKPPMIRLNVASDPIKVRPATGAPVWHDAGRIAEIPPGTMRGTRIDEAAILLCNIVGEIFAWEDACPDTPLVLSAGQLEGDEIVCPWHGCRFDARSGKRLVHRGMGLVAYPVDVVRGVVRVAVNLRGSTLAGGS